LLIFETRGNNNSTVLYLYSGVVVLGGGDKIGQREAMEAERKWGKN
jgi:hypothetical protein